MGAFPRMTWLSPTSEDTPAGSENTRSRPYDGTEQITPQCGKTPRWRRDTIVPRLVRHELVEAGIAWGSVE
jgi:hypothetical protein